MLLDGKFNKNSENVLKTVFFLFQVGFTSNFVLDVLYQNCTFKLCFWQFKLWHVFMCDCTKFCRLL